MLVVVLLGVAACAALAMLLVDAVTPRTVRPAALALLGVTMLYGGWVLLEERRARRVLRALIAQRERAVSLTARVDALGSLEWTIREIAEAEELPDVFSRLLEGVLHLTAASSGAVLLDAAGELTVAASTGPGAPTRGTRLSPAAGPIAAAIEHDEPVLAGRGAPWGGEVDRSVIAAPLRDGQRIVGAVAVERDASAPAFGRSDVTLVGLFAAHAGLALRRVWGLESHRDDAASLRDEAVVLRQLATARAEAVAGIVHDLRSPLTSIGGFLQLLERRSEALTPERRNAILVDVGAEVRRLRGMVDDLLTVAVAEADAPLPDELVDVAELARRAVRSGRGMVAARDDGRRLRLDATGPAVVRGDAGALERLVVNLLDNAVSHTPDGTDVQVRVERGDGKVTVSVLDAGPPVDPAVLEGAFDPFVSGPSGGSGLGLHVVRTVAERHGGVASLAPAPGGGTLAEVILPAASVGPADQLPR